MFDFIHNNKRLAQIILALVMLPFAFFGIESYIQSSGRSGDYVASVGGERISQREFMQALKEQQERLRTLLKGNALPEQLNSPELRNSVLDSLIRKHLLLQQAARARLVIGDAQLQAEIAAIPVFQENGKFSRTRYETLLRNQNLTPVLFEQRMRQDLLQEQIGDLYADAGFASSSVVERLLRSAEQQREISQATLALESFIGQAKLAPDAAQAYYREHQSEFQVPEQARVEYLVLSLDTLLPRMEVGADELKKYYDEHAAQFQQAEERQISHILIALPPGADAAAKEAARQQAEQIAAQARKNPAAFAELAKKYSQDGDSAQRGGDLGTFKRGMSPEMKPLEDALFALQPNQVSSPVQSSFGYHIVKLTAIKGSQTPKFEQIKGQLESELKKQKAVKQYAELADNFSNLVYEQADSLKPAADALKLTLQQSGWLMKTGSAQPLLGNAKLLGAVFAEDALKNKRNTEAIEVAPNTLVAARVTEYQAASVRPFGQVGKAIAERLARDEALKLAVAAGQAKLSLLRQGKDAGVAWSAPLTVSREHTQGLGGTVLLQAFKTDASTLPAYAGAETPQGYALVKVSRVIEADNIPAEQRKAFSQQIWRLAAQDEFASALASLRQTVEIKIKPAETQ